MLSLLLPVIALLLAYWLLRTIQIGVNTSHNVLLVTAHPDDELMFFGPTLLREIRARVQPSNGNKRSQVHLLCLSNGDFYGDGVRRTQELTDACNYLVDYCIDLKSRTSNKELPVFVLKVVQDSQLPDSASAIWPPHLIRQYVADYVRQHKISKVITFDQFGVSGHSNHVAIHNSLKNSLNGSAELWQLQTKPLWRKYLSVFDLLFTCILSIFEHNLHIHLISPRDYFYLVQALWHHQSQMLWFRYLYSFTSRYMFINELNLL